VADDKNSTQPPNLNRSSADRDTKTSSGIKGHAAASISAGSSGLSELKKSVRAVTGEKRKKLAREKAELSRIFLKKANEVKAVKSALSRKQRSLEKRISGLRKEYAAEKVRLLKELRHRDAELKRKSLSGDTAVLEAQELWVRREQEIKHKQDKALRELKAAEEKLLAEREKNWLSALKSKEEESGALKVELALQESKIRSLAHKQEEELAGMKERAEELVEDRTRKVLVEKDRLLGLISLKEKEVEDLRRDFKEKEDHFLKAIEAQELESRVVAARAEQEMKEREKKVWAERESWLKALQAQFEKKEKDFSSFLEREKGLSAAAEKAHKEKMAILLSEIEKKDAAIAKLRDELATLINSKRGEIEKLGAFFQSELKVLEGRLRRQEAEKDEALRKGALKEKELRREIDISEKAVAELSEKLLGRDNVWKERLEQKASEVLGAKSETVQKARELEEVRSRLSSEKSRLLENLNRRESEINRELGLKNDEIASLQKKLDGIDREWRGKLEAERQDLFGRLTAAEFALKREEGKAADAMSRQEQAAARFAAAMAEAKTAKEDAVRFEAELRTIRAEKRRIEDDYSARLLDKESQLKKIIRDSSANELELVALRAELRKIELDRDLKLTHSNERVLALETELKKRNPLPAGRDEELSAARELGEERRKKLVAFYDTAGRLEEEKFRAELESKKAREKLEQAVRELAAAKAEAALSSSGRKQAEEEYRSLQRQKESAELLLKQSAGEKERLERELSAVTLKRESTEGRLAELTERHNALERARKEAEEARLSSEEQYAELYAEYERLSGETAVPSAGEIEELRESISELESERSALKKDLSRAASDRARLAGAAEKAEREAETAEAALRDAERGFEAKLYREGRELREKERQFAELTEVLDRKEAELKKLRADADIRFAQLKEEFGRREREYVQLSGSVESKLAGFNAERPEGVDAAGKEADRFRQEAGRQLYRVEQFTAEILSLRSEIKARDEQLAVVNKEKAEALRDLSAKLEASDSQAREFAERIIKEQKKLADVIGLNEQLKAELASGSGFAEKYKGKESEIDAIKREYKLKAEDAAARSLDALKGREEALARAAEAERISKEKDLELLAVKTRLSTQIKELSGHIEIKEKELQGIRSMLSELEQKARSEFELKGEELKLAINRLQLQLKNVTGKTEAELNEKEQKVKSMQTEYALREVQWKQQKETNERDRERIALFEAEIARLREESSNSIKELQAVVEHQKRRLTETENYLHAREEETKLANEKLREEVAAREELQASHSDELAAKEGMFAAKEWGLNAKIGDLASEKNNLEAENAAITGRIDEAEAALAALRRRFRLLLWFWYPNEPRN